MIVNFVGNPSEWEILIFQVAMWAGNIAIIIVVMSSLVIVAMAVMED